MLDLIKSSVELVDGVLTWKKDRPVSHFDCSRGYNTWKTNYAGKVVGCVNNDGYTVFNVSLNKKVHLIGAHVAVFALTNDRMPDNYVDHINGKRSDNSVDNLRDVTACVQSKNLAQRSDNSSGITGVCWDKQTGKWRVQGRSEYLPFRPKRVADFFEACCTRKSWEVREGFSRRHGTNKEDNQ